MTQDSMTTVQITFQPPSRAGLPRSSSVHERCLEAVPAPTAEQMVQDFAAYRAAPSTAEQKKLYTYPQDDDEAFVALDFGEVVALQTRGKTVGPAEETEPALA